MFKLPPHRGLLPEQAIPRETPQDQIKPSGRAVWEMRTDLPWDPKSEDVVLSRESVFDPDIKSEIERVTTNIRWTAIDSSDTGFNWGYGGSGPYDLALNILNQFVPPGTDGYESAACREGVVSFTAKRFASSFTRDFLRDAPERGLTLNGKKIRAWLEEKQSELGNRIGDMQLPNHFSEYHQSPFEKETFRSNDATVRTDAQMDSPQAGDSRELRSAGRSLQRTALVYLRGEARKVARSASFSNPTDGAEKWKPFYRSALKLARQYHAMDVELLRAEVRGVAVDMTPHILELPTELQDAARNLIQTYRSSSNVARSLANQAPAGALLGALGVTSVVKITTNSLGPSLVIAAQSKDDWKTIVRERFADETSNPDHVGAFKTVINVNGMGCFCLAMPHLAQDYSNMGWLRSTLVHERQHVLTDMLQGWSLPDPEQAPKADKELIELIQDLHLADLRSEIVSRTTEGKPSSLRNPKLFSPHGLYDYPKRDREYLRGYLAKACPNHSKEQIDDLLTTAEERYFEKASSLLRSINLNFQHSDLNIPVFVRVLELLPTRHWQRHIERLGILYGNLSRA